MTVVAPRPGLYGTEVAVRQWCLSKWRVASGLFPPRLQQNSYFLVAYTSPWLNPPWVFSSLRLCRSGEGLKRLDYRTQRWDCALAAYITSLEARGKPVVLTGDLNCAHKEIDIHNPKGNLRSAGFTIVRGAGPGGVREAGVGRGEQEAGASA